MSPPSAPVCLELDRLPHRGGDPDDAEGCNDRENRHAPLKPGTRQAQQVCGHIQHLAQLCRFMQRVGDHDKDHRPGKSGDDVNRSVHSGREFRLQQVDGDMPAVAVAKRHASEDQNSHPHINQVLAAKERRTKGAAHHINQNNTDEPQQAEPADESGQANQPVRKFAQKRHYSPRITARAASPSTSAT